MSTVASGDIVPINQPYAYTGGTMCPPSGPGPGAEMRHAPLARYKGGHAPRARYYMPEIGRFIQQDPIGFAGGDVNFYAYAGNNPVNFVDPLGLAPGQPLRMNTIDPGDTSSQLLRQYSEPSSQQSLPDFTLSVGVGGALALLYSNISGNTGLSLDSTGKVCITFERCLGAGLSSGGGVALGITGSISPNEMCPGESKEPVLGAIWFGGVGLAGEGQINSNEYGRGLIGVGVGVAGGVNACSPYNWCIFD